MAKMHLIKNNAIRQKIIGMKNYNTVKGGGSVVAFYEIQML